MRVLYLTINPNLGSSTRTLQDWLLLGREEGLQPHVCLRAAGPFSHWLQEHRIPYRIDPMPWPSRRAPWRSLRSAWGLWQWCRSHRIELIHAEHDVYPLASVLGRVTGCPAICHFHFGVSREFCQWAFAGKRLPAALLWTSHQQHSDCAASTAGLVPEERHYIVPLGVDVARFGTRAGLRKATREQWGIGPNEVVFGTASAIQPRKRTLDFVALIEQLGRKHHEVKGVIAGDARPGDEAYREEVLAKIGVEMGHRFRWLGRIVDIETLYQGIDVYVSTSEYETFGMSVCEAMACGRPVLAYRGGSIHEVVGDAGLVAANTDLHQLQQYGEQLVADTALRCSLGQLAKQRVAEHFSPVSTWPRLRDIYHEILVKRRA